MALFWDLQVSVTPNMELIMAETVGKLEDRIVSVYRLFTGSFL